MLFNSTAVGTHRRAHIGPFAVLEPLKGSMVIRKGSFVDFQ